MANEIAEVAFAYNPSGLNKAKAALDAIVPSAAKVEKAQLAIAKADLAAARATLAAAKASGTATKEQIAAATAAVRKAAATASAAQADAKAAIALSAVDRAAKGTANSVTAVGNAATGATSKLARLGSVANDNLTAVQATPANIAAQFQDIGVTAAAGMNPLLIGLQQGAQLGPAFVGGLKNIGPALMSLITPTSLLAIGLATGLAYLIQWGVAAFSADAKTQGLIESYESLKFATDGVSDAQTILGKVFDLTTGKMERNTAVAMLNARAQLMVLEATSRAKAAEAQGEIRNAYSAGFFEADTRVKNPTYARIIGPVLAAKNATERATEAMKAIEKMRAPDFRKLFGEEVAIKATVAMANLSQETLNVATAQAALNDLSKGVLSDQFIKPEKEKKTRKEAKSDGEKLIDVWASANAEIATENTRRMAAGLNVTNEESATLAQRTKLMNELQSKGLPITQATISKVNELAAAYGKAKSAADAAEAITEILKGSDAEIAGLQTQIDLIGKQGRELAYAAAMAKMLADAKQKGLTGAEIEAATPMFKAKAGAIADKSEELRNKAFMQDLIKDAERRNFQLETERNELGLTGAVLAAYRYKREMLNRAEQEGIKLSIPQREAIKETARLYGEETEKIELRRKAIERARQALEFDRETTRGFFRDLIQGARDGKGAWESFSNAFNNLMDRIIDKLLNDVLDAIFQVNSAASGGGGGLFSFLTKAVGLVGASPQASLAGDAASTIAANPSLFAKGDTFTNSIVSRPTAFAFGRGGANLGIMGEAGDEAILPLQRGPDGSLGVQMYGSVNSPATPTPGPITFDMRGAVVTQDLLEQMDQIAANRSDVAVIRERTRNVRSGQRKFG